MRNNRLVAAALAALLAAGSANAVTTVVKGHDNNTSGGYAATSNPNADAAASSFAGSLSGTSTESFENFAVNQAAPLTLAFTGSNGSTINATLSGSGSVQSATRAQPTSSGQFAVDGSKYYQVTSQNFNIAFGGNGVAAFGFYSTDIESDLQITLTLASGATQTYGYTSLFNTTTSTPSGSVDFLGFINTGDLIKNVAFAPPASGGSDIFAFDKMQVGDAQQVTSVPGVPEPSTWAMMLTGFGAIGVALRAKRGANVFAAR